MSPQSALHYFAPHLARQSEGAIRVRATATGFHGNTLREPGDEFTIGAMDEFGAWMELVDDDPSRELDASAPAGAAQPPSEKLSTKKPGKAKSEDDVL